MASLNRFRLITFDVTNTLLQFRTSRVKQYGEIGALFGVLCDDNELAKNFRINWIKMNQSHPNFGRNSQMEWQKWWHQLIANTFSDTGAKIPEEKFDGFADHLIELYKSSLCWSQCNGAVDFLKFLRNTKDFTIDQFKLGVIANFDPRLNSLLRNMKIDQFFDFTINSYDCEVEKPNKEIFDIAIRTSKLQNLKPSECLHVGDGPTTDFIGARTAGWSAILVHERNPKYLVEKYGDKIDVNYVFPSLYDFQKKLIHNAINW